MLKLNIVLFALLLMTRFNANGQRHTFDIKGVSYTVDSQDDVGVLYTTIVVKNNSGKDIYFPEGNGGGYSIDSCFFKVIGVILANPFNPPGPDAEIPLMHLRNRDSVSFRDTLTLSNGPFRKKLFRLSTDFVFADQLDVTKYHKSRWLNIDGKKVSWNYLDVPYKVYSGIAHRGDWILQMPGLAEISSLSNADSARYFLVKNHPN